MECSACHAYSEEYEHFRVLGNVFLISMVGFCTGRYLSDALNGYKAFRRNVFADFEYTLRALEIITNTLRKGYRIVELNSHERARAGGEIKSSVVRHGTRFLLRILWEGLIKGVKPIEIKTGSADTTLMEKTGKTN